MRRLLALLLLSLTVSLAAYAQRGVLVAGVKVTAPLAGAVVVDSGVLDLPLIGISGSCSPGSTEALWTLTVIAAAQASGVYRLVFFDATTPTPSVIKTMLFFIPAAQTVSLPALSLSLPVGGKIQVQPDSTVGAGLVAVANLNLAFEGCL